MYVLDQDGNCIMKAPVSYGPGIPPQDMPRPCMDNGKHATPPGFHILKYHSAEKYQADESFGMTGLQGQDSYDRTILIHPKNSKGATTWGCLGIPPNAIEHLKKEVTYDTLAYNDFGDTKPLPGCKRKYDPGLCKYDLSGARGSTRVNFGDSDATPAAQ